MKGKKAKGTQMQQQPKKTPKVDLHRIEGPKQQVKKSGLINLNTNNKPAATSERSPDIRLTKEKSKPSFKIVNTFRVYILLRQPIPHED